MKKVIQIIFTIIIWYCAATQVSAESTKISEKNFPDNFFRIYVRKFDNNNDGKLSEAEKKKVKEINVGENSEFQLECEYPTPYSLKGIEYFTELEKLDCSDCSLRQINLKSLKKLRQFNCKKNMIKKLNLSKNVELTYLDCRNNRITAINLKKNVNLLEFYCDANKLKKVNISKNRKIRKLSISNNKIKKIEVRFLSNLTEFYCDRNRICKLDVSHNRKLVTLNCYDNKVKKLNLKRNKDLDYLACSDNNITQLDLRNNRLLAYLFCENNNLVTGNVRLPYSQLARADISPQKKTIQAKKIGKYYYVPIKGINKTNEITNLSTGKITEKGIRLKGKKIPKKITYEYNMFTDGDEKTKVEIRVKSGKIKKKKD